MPILPLVWVAMAEGSRGHQWPAEGREGINARWHFADGSVGRGVPADFAALARDWHTTGIADIAALAEWDGGRAALPFLPEFGGGSVIRAANGGEMAAGAAWAGRYAVV